MTSNEDSLTLGEQVTNDICDRMRLARPRRALHKDGTVVMQLFGYSKLFLVGWLRE
jgi:hypothetical protein